MPKVSQYETEDGKVPFAAWFESLDTRPALKVRAAIAQMEAGNPGDNKSVGGGVRERRIDFEKGYRLYFGQDGSDLVLLLCGGIKRRQDADIEKAKELWAEYKARKKTQSKTKQSKGKPRKQK